MSASRPTVSMVRQIYRWLSYAAETRGESRSAIVQMAIVAQMRLWHVPQPPDDWTSTAGNGRRSRASAAADAGFTF